MTDIKFGYARVDELKPDPRNARTHSKKQIDQIAANITATEFYNPVVVNAAGVIIAGHGRLLAAKQLGLETVPIVTLTGLSDAAERRLRIADNKIALNGGWNVDLMKVELEAIRAEGLDLELTGFSIGEIDVMLTGQPDPSDDEIPTMPVTPVSRIGDIWICGDHRIGCGDILDDTSLIALMAGGAADGAFLDPPYNVKNNGHAGGNGKIKHAEFAYASGDMNASEFTGFLRATLGACAGVSRDGAVHFVCMDHHHTNELVEACGTVYGARLNIAVWVKSNAGMGSLYRSHHELVFVYRVGTGQHRNNVELGKHGRNRTNVWEYSSVNTFGSRQNDLEMHPTVKPTALVADAIRDVTKTGEIVLDAFLGSGTTLIAAEQTGRRAFGLEIDPGYVDVAVRRWMAMTGGEPVLEATGERFSDLARTGRVTETMAMAEMGA